MERKGWIGTDFLMLEQQNDILKETLRVEEEMELRLTSEEEKDISGVRMLEDRCGIGCLIYARLLEEERLSNLGVTNVDSDKSPFWETLFARVQDRSAINRYRNSLIILLEPAEEFLEDDG